VNKFIFGFLCGALVLTLIVSFDGGCCGKLQAQQNRFNKPNTFSDPPSTTLEQWRLEFGRPQPTPSTPYGKPC